MGFLIGTRKTVDTFISRAKGQLYQEAGADKISNVFNAKIINKTTEAIALSLRLEDLPGEVKLIGTNQIILKKEAINEYTFFLEIPKDAIRARSNNIKIAVYRGEEKIQTIKTKFLGPFK